jgi:hypothetical protein
MTRARCTNHDATADLALTESNGQPYVLMQEAREPVEMPTSHEGQLHGTLGEAAR